MDVSITVRYTKRYLDQKFQPITLLKHEKSSIIVSVKYYS